MSAIVRITGKSGSGKTTLIERLIPALKRRGLSTVVVKHAPRGVDLTEKRKDSRRFLEAGAREVLLATRAGLVHFMPSRREVPLPEAVLEFKKDADVILVEGYKSDTRFPEIEVTGPSRITPRFVKETAGAIARKVKNSRVHRKKGPRTSVWVNGKRIGLNDFVQDLFSASLLGMVSTLKGAGKIRTLHLKVTRSST